MADARNLDHMPDSMREIADVIGVDGALQLCHAFGGTEIYLPQTPKPNNRVVRELGPSETMKLIQAFGSGHLTVPMGPNTDAQRKRQLIVEMLGAGTSHTEVAQRVNCHVRTVGRIAGEMRQHNQGDLFSSDDESDS